MKEVKPIQLIYNDEYQNVNNSQTISAITDKLMMSNVFLGQLVNSKENLENVLKESGFELYGQVSEIFKEVIYQMREKIEDILKNVESEIQRIEGDVEYE